MKCPIDDSELSMTDRQGIEIDYCPKCRGVWLDRGELDKMIERSNTLAPVAQAPSQPENARYEQSPRHQDDNYDNRGYDQKKRKKEGFLGEMFDF